MISLEENIQHGYNYSVMKCEQPSYLLRLSWRHLSKLWHNEWAVTDNGCFPKHCGSFSCSMARTDFSCCSNGETIVTAKMWSISNKTAAVKTSEMNTDLACIRFVYRYMQLLKTLTEGQNLASNRGGGDRPANRTLHTKSWMSLCISGTWRTPAKVSCFTLLKTRLSVGKQLVSSWNTHAHTVILQHFM